MEVDRKLKYEDSRLKKKFIPNNLDKFLNIYTTSVSIKNYVDIIGGLYIIVEI